MAKHPKTHAGRHGEGNTGRAHRRTTLNLRESVHEPSATMPGGAIHPTKGHPQSSIGRREDTGEGVTSPLVEFERSQKEARARLGNTGSLAGFSPTGGGMSLGFNWPDAIGEMAKRNATPNRPEEPDIPAFEPYGGA